MRVYQKKTNEMKMFSNYHKLLIPSFHPCSLLYFNKISIHIGVYCCFDVVVFRIKSLIIVDVVAVIV